jgi:hypothetical protein
VVDHLAYYRDLTPEERRAVDSHLATCAECRATFAEFQKQDAALASLRALHPRRTWRPEGRRTTGPRQIAARLGDVLVLGALAALIWLFALQVQAVSQAGPGPAIEPAALPEPGIVLPPTRLQLPSPWLPALPWVAAALLGTGTLFVLSRRSLAATIIGALAAGFLLISFIPPLSLLPNPAALYWRVAGGYSYDPRLPFKNNFLIAGSPEREIKPYLDQLIGQRGLAPLDPHQPLLRYEILRVGLHPAKNRVALVTTRFIYADGSSRIYPVPMFTPTLDLFGFWLGGWSEDGLQRLRSEHLAFPGQPFAGASSPIRFGPAQRLELHPSANRLDETNPAHWLWESVRVDRLVVAPDGSAFLIAIEQDAAQRQLWLVPLNGSAPAAIGAAGDIREYGWSPDSRWIVYTRFDPEASVVDPRQPFAVMSVAREGNVSRDFGVGGAVTLATGLGVEQLPGLTGQGAWFFSEDALWRAPFDGGQPTRLLAETFSDLAPRVTTDGLRVAYACAEGLCFVNADGSGLTTLAGVYPDEMTWSPDGSALAIVDRDRNNLRPVQLIIATPSGGELSRFEIAPRDVTDAPQWTPDGGALFIQTFPQDGRRIIAVDLTSEQALDLSQEHWDAYFALMPDGRSLLLNNGRGDFWMAEVLR